MRVSEMFQRFIEEQLLVGQEAQIFLRLEGDAVCVTQTLVYTTRGAKQSRPTFSRIEPTGRAVESEAFDPL